jgi:hypothetical protein
MGHMIITVWSIIVMDKSISLKLVAAKPRVLLFPALSGNSGSYRVRFYLMGSAHIRKHWFFSSLYYFFCSHGFSMNDTTTGQGCDTTVIFQVSFKWYKVSLRVFNRDFFQMPRNIFTLLKILVNIISNAWIIFQPSERLSSDHMNIFPNQWPLYFVFVILLSSTAWTLFWN